MSSNNPLYPFLSLFLSVIPRAIIQYNAYMHGNGDPALEQCIFNTLFTPENMLLASLVFTLCLQIDGDGARAIGKKFSRDRTIVGVARLIRDAERDGAKVEDEDVKNWLLKNIAAIDRKRKLSLMDEVRKSFVVMGVCSLWELAVLIAGANFRRAGSTVVRVVGGVWKWVVGARDIVVRNTGLAGLKVLCEDVYWGLEGLECVECVDAGDATKDAAQMEVEFERLDRRLARMEKRRKGRRGARKCQSFVLNEENGSGLDGDMSANPWPMHSPTNERDDEEMMASMRLAAAFDSLNPQPQKSLKNERTEKIKKTKTPTWMSLARERRERDASVQTQARIDTLKERMEHVESIVKLLKQERVEVSKADLKLCHATLLAGQGRGPGGSYRHVSNAEIAAAGQRRVESEYMYSPSFKREGFNLLDATLKDVRAEKEKEGGRSDNIDETREECMASDTGPIQFKLAIGNDYRENDSMRGAVGMQEAEILGKLMAKDEEGRGEGWRPSSRELETDEKGDEDGEWVDCAEFLDT
ncbi:hypothetical protein IFR05_015159 [Cadophora sp. M221]|nr:hypothetical protein IFR05_015159 [Cadophora sp. M221]